MPVYNASKLFATPKKRGRPRTKKASLCAPKVPFNACESPAKMEHCIWVHGKRQYCRTRRNKSRAKKN